MSNVLIESTTLDSLAEMIAVKSGEALPLSLSEMIDAVHGIPDGGGTPTLQDKTVNITPSTSAQTQTVSADVGYDGLDEVTINTAAYTPTLQTITKTYTPSTVQQTDTITPSVGYDGIGEVDVTVSAVPMGNKGSNVITTNSAAYGGQYYITTFSYPNATSGYYQYQDINAISITLTNESKTITPSETVQTVIPTSTTRYLSAVTVNAISSAYVGTGVPRMSATDMTISGATVTAPSGYYSAAASVAFPSASYYHVFPSVTSNSWAVESSGLVNHYFEYGGSYSFVGAPGFASATDTLDVYNSGTETYQLPSAAAHTYHPSTADQTIASQAWLTGTQTFKSVVTANIVAANIVSGVTVTVGDADDPDRILSVTGTGGGGGGSAVQVETIAPAYPQTDSITISGLKGTPTSFILYCDDVISTSATARVVAVAYDGSDLYGQTVSNGVVYSPDFSMSYSSGSLTITPTAGQQFAMTEYVFVYSYGGSASAVGTQHVQVGSGATSITFTGLPRKPLYWSCIFTSDFSTSSGYQRVICVTDTSSYVAGVAMDTSTHPLLVWTQSYSSGSLTITSQGTNNGGYFHQPGYYLLTYVTDDSAPQYETKTVTFTPATTTQTQTVTASSGYDALEEVDITVNPIPSQYIIPTGNYAITSNGNNINVANYATVSVNVSGGSDWQVDTKTLTASNYPVSIGFASMKGQPKAFFLRTTTQISSSGSTTYYYIIDMRYNGTNTTGNCFRIGSTRRVDNVTSGYTWSYSNSTLTINSSAASRSASPGAFNGSYELVYFY